MFWFPVDVRYDDDAEEAGQGDDDVQDRVVHILLHLKNETGWVCLQSPRAVGVPNHKGRNQGIEDNETLLCNISVFLHTYYTFSKLPRCLEGNILTWEDCVEASVLLNAATVKLDAGTGLGISIRSITIRPKHLDWFNHNFGYEYISTL